MAITKGFKDLLAEANAVIDLVSVQEAKGLLNEPYVVFVDLREGEELAQGRVPGAVHVPRGLLEFVADPDGPMHNPAISAEKRLVMFCGSGGRSALAAKTLYDMGFPQVASMAGGFQAWVEADAPVETAKEA